MIVAMVVVGVVSAAVTVFFAMRRARRRAVERVRIPIGAPRLAALGARGRMVPRRPMAPLKPEEEEDSRRRWTPVPPDDSVFGYNVLADTTSVEMARSDPSPEAWTGGGGESGGGGATGSWDAPSDSSSSDSSSSSSDSGSSTTGSDP
jgi:uncharacterized membrane protein YgcG